uniref:NADH-ubiquinone oxidoreductase chain 4 n=1 Tax=Neofoleyellides sp. XM-2022 TaxID=3014012 RepID=A0A9E9FW38_9BILA|nr:NADH dehydrogenase subunit 4 [Neofoleyellides sp. XM-2022]
MFFLVIFLCLFNYFFFFIFLFLFVLYGFLDISWSGGFFFFDSLSYVILSFMSVFVMGFVDLVEFAKGLVFYVYMVIFFSVCFFFSGSLLMMYVFYELTVIFILFSVLGYGYQVEKISACYYLVFYTLFFSFPFLFLYNFLSFFFNFVYFDFFMSYEFVFFLSLCFLVKFPIYFLHVWLPKVHVESPTSVSMVLAGVMLKLGGVGIYRICKSMNFFGLEVWFFISLLGMIIGSFVCIFQVDLKSLVAYSSICHMNFVLLSQVSMVYYGKSMSLVMMVSHGYISVMLFYFVGEFYHYFGSRLIYYLRGCFNLSIIFCLFFCLGLMSNFSFPLSVSFFSEYIMLNYCISIFYFFIIFLFFYYLVSFYYSLYVLVCSIVGSSLVFMEDIRFLVSMPLLLVVYNFFWFVFVI